MFDDLVISSVQAKRTHKSWTVALSAGIQILIVGVMILVPLLVTEALPKGMLATYLITPPPPAPPPPPPAVVKIVKPVHLIQAGKLVTPTVVPKEIHIIKEEAAPDVGVSGGVVGGVAGGSVGGVLGGIIGGTGPPPPPKPPSKPQRIGGDVMAAQLIHMVKPEYPMIAKTAHQQGTVVFHALIGTDGTIQQLQFISGPAMLMPAARAAIQQWRYRPTMLNNEPVQVETTISFEFMLGGD